MRFHTLFDADVQTHPMAEGGWLIAAGLLRPVFDDDMVTEVEATDALAAYFGDLPPLERLDSLRVEFVACGRYAEFPGFWDDRAAWRGCGRWQTWQLQPSGSISICTIRQGRRPSGSGGIRS